MSNVLIWLFGHFWYFSPVAINSMDATFPKTLHLFSEQSSTIREDFHYYLRANCGIDQLCDDDGLKESFCSSQLDPSQNFSPLREISRSLRSKASFIPLENVVKVLSASIKTIYMYEAYSNKKPIQRRHHHHVRSQFLVDICLRCGKRWIDKTLNTKGATLSRHLFGFPCRLTASPCFGILSLKGKSCAVHWKIVSGIGCHWDVNQIFFVE